MRRDWIEAAGDMFSGWKLGTALLAIAITLIMMFCARYDPRNVVAPLQAQVTQHAVLIQGLNEKVDALTRYDCLKDPTNAELAGMECHTLLGN